VILGCASPSPDEVNIGRVVACASVAATRCRRWTVMRNCASGMQAIDSAIANIQNGRSQLVLAGGVDALSHAPLLYNDDGALVWQMMQARTLGAEDRHVRQAAPGAAAVAGDRHAQGADRPGDWPADGADRGEPRLALRHLAPADGSNSACAATSAPSPRAPPGVSARSCRWSMARQGLCEDDGVRADSSLAGLAKLKPFFDRKYGRVTPGNSSQITDGAAWLILASAGGGRQVATGAARQDHRQPVGRPRPGADGPRPGACGDADPAAARLALDDIDLWEINEAFAAQVLGCSPPGNRTSTAVSSSACRGRWAALPGSSQRRRRRDCRRPPGRRVRRAHRPAPAAGLRAAKARRGIAAICIGGGQGGAMLVETMSREPARRGNQ
jgi:acetyl-CoA C-acetyltransferase